LVGTSKNQLFTSAFAGVLFFLSNCFEGMFIILRRFTMSLTPLDIHNKEFKRGWRGYDEDQVNEFLDQVIKDYEALIRENKDLQNQVQTVQERLSHFATMEETLSKTLIIAQETAEEVKMNAKKEAQLVMREAEKNADRIINESLVKSGRIALETEELKKQASVYRTRFRMLVEAQLELIQTEGWDTLEPRTGIE
jgi:cell division initiation protein